VGAHDRRHPSGQQMAKDAVRRVER